MAKAPLRTHLPDPRTGMETIETDDCYRLLAEHQHEVGRVAFMDAGEPTIVPVNYALVENRVVFRTAPGAKLDAARHVGRVAFEIDHVDAERRTGWSVLVRGRAEVVTGQHELYVLQTLGLSSFTESEKAYWVLIEPDAVTGRRVPLGGAFFW